MDVANLIGKYIEPDTRGGSGRHGGGQIMTTKGATSNVQSMQNQGEGTVAKTGTSTTGKARPIGQGRPER
jgi:hypothetical protein